MISSEKKHCIIELLIHMALRDTEVGMVRSNMLLNKIMICGISMEEYKFYVSAYYLHKHLITDETVFIKNLLQRIDTKENIGIFAHCIDLAWCSEMTPEKKDFFKLLSLELNICEEDYRAAMFLTGQKYLIQMEIFLS